MDVSFSLTNCATFTPDDEFVTLTVIVPRMLNVKLIQIVLDTTVLFAGVTAVIAGGVASPAITKTAYSNAMRKTLKANIVNGFLFKI